MTGFRGSDDTGRVANPLTPESLRPLLQEAPASVLVERDGDGQPARLRAIRAPAGRWRLELRSGDGVGLATTVPNTDAAFDAVRSWAADDGWWREAFAWAPTP